MTQKSTLPFLAAAMLLSACATESSLTTGAEPVGSLVAETTTPSQVAAPMSALAEAKPFEIKAANKPAGDQDFGRIALAPDFHQYMLNWAGAVQTSLTPWTDAIKQCDTRGSGKY